MSESYPYLTLARQYDLNYGDVLNAATEIETNGYLELQSRLWRKFSFSEQIAIRKTFEKELARRKEVLRNG